MDTSSREDGGLRSLCSSAGTLLVCQTDLDEHWKALENDLTDIRRRAPAASGALLSAAWSGSARASGSPVSHLRLRPQCLHWRSPPGLDPAVFRIETPSSKARTGRMC